MKEFNLQVSKKVKKFIWTQCTSFRSIVFSLNQKERNKNLHLEVREVDSVEAEEVEEETSEGETEEEEISEEETLEVEISEAEIEAVINGYNKNIISEF
jgi:hypothetical protein